MINIQLENSQEVIDIRVDDEGVEELIKLLRFIQKSKDHFHLVSGNELTESIESTGYSSISVANLRYIDNEN